jgi:hypothetical protein
MSGVTPNEFAFALAHEKFTNCPGAAKAGDTVKLDTTGVDDVPAPAVPSPLLPPIALFAEPLEASRANPAATNKHKRTRRTGKTRSLDINVNPPLI